MKNIKGYILILLLLLSSNHYVDFSRSQTPVPEINASHFHNASKVADLTVAITTHSLKRDWIKVRYMGGECKYEAFVLTGIVIAPEFIDNTKGIQYISFVSSSHPFLFKLRGPPSC